MLFFSRIRSTIGLEFTDTELVAVQLQQTKRGRYLKNYAVLPLSNKEIIDGKISHPEELAAIISTLLKNFYLKRARLVIGLPFNQIIIKKIQLPKNLSSKAYAAEINDTVHHYFSGVKQPLRFDFMVDQSVNKILADAIVVVAKGEDLQSFQSVINSKQIPLLAIDVSTLGLLRAVKFYANQKLANGFIILNRVDNKMHCVVVESEMILSNQVWLIENTEAVIEKIDHVLQLYQSLIEQMVFTADTIFYHHFQHTNKNCSLLDVQRIRSKDQTIKQWVSNLPKLLPSIGLAMRS